MFKVLAIVVALVVIGAVFYVAVLNDDDGSDDDPDSYTSTYDMADRNVTAVVDMDVQYIVASGVGALRFVSYLDCADLVVAVEARENFKYNAKSYMYAYEYDNVSNYDHSIGSGADGLIEYPEQLLMLSNVPQVIIYSVPSTTLTAEQQTYISNAESLGMKVVVILELDTMLNDDSDGLSETFVSQTMLLGTVLNKTERAVGLLSYMNSTIADLVSRMSGVSQADKDVTAYIGSLSYSGAKGFDYSSSWYDPFAILGVNNSVIGGSSVVYQINIESIIESNPEYVFLDPTGYKTFKTNWNNGSSAASSDALMALTAFQEGNVYITIPFIWYGVNFDNVLLGAYYIGSILYPEAFDDVNMTEMASEIYTAFVGYDCYEEMNAWFFANMSTNMTGVASVVAP
jgi:iron complex transport system substrate-binding protein